MTTQQAYEAIAVSVAEGVATITLNRPDDLNPLSVPMALEVLSVLEQVDTDPEIRAVLLTGAGRAFSSGADLKGGDRGLTPEGKPDVLSALRTAYNPLIVKLMQLETPVVAAVNGGAVGIGASLAFACDLIVAAENAYFLLAFVNIGLTIDGGASVVLPARIGYARAMEMAMLGERIPAATAKQWGLVNQVVPAEELASVAGGLAAKLAAGPPGSYRASKRLMLSACLPDLAERLDAEAVAQQERAESVDFVEGVMAFLQKRPANFQGN
jgi:2-(1,2-epoxy-1,2-dihydrophenyl)acetyl-CoA isomerase